MLTSNSDSTECSQEAHLLSVWVMVRTLGHRSMSQAMAYLHQVGEYGKGKGETLGLGMVIGISRVRVRGACL